MNKFWQKMLADYAPLILQRQTTGGSFEWQQPALFNKSNEMACSGSGNSLQSECMLTLVRIL